MPVCYSGRRLSAEAASGPTTQASRQSDFVDRGRETINALLVQVHNARQNLLQLRTSASGRRGPECATRLRQSEQALVDFVETDRSFASCRIAPGARALRSIR